MSGVRLHNPIYSLEGFVVIFMVMAMMVLRIHVSYTIFVVLFSKRMRIELAYLSSYLEQLRLNMIQMLAASVRVWLHGGVYKVSERRIHTSIVFPTAELSNKSSICKNSSLKLTEKKLRRVMETQISARQSIN